MTARMVTVGTSTWRFAPDSPPPWSENLQALLRVQLTDEIAAAPPDVPIEASTPMHGVTARASTNGLAGLIGRPLSLFAPGFVSGAPLLMYVAAEGFLPLAVSTQLGPQPGYPDAFTPADLGTMALHRAPTSISGRTVSHLHVPRAGANVQVESIWLAEGDLLNPPAVPNIISSAPGLYVDRPAGGSVRKFNVSPAPPAETKRLILPAMAGASELRLSDQIGLAVGTLLIVDPPDPGRSEIAVITAIIDPGSGPDLAATGLLAHPLRRDHQEGAAVIRAVPGASGPANALNRAAQSGDVTLFPSTMTGLDASMNAVEITGGVSPPEYHWAAVYAVLSDANGYYRLPPLHRIAQVQLRADHVSEPTPEIRPVSLDWGCSNIIVDLVFP